MHMRIAFLIAVLLPGYVFSQSLVGHVYESEQAAVRIEFTETEMVWTETDWNSPDFTSIENRYEYHITTENKLVFIEYGEDYSHRLLAIYNDEIIFVYDDDNAPPVYIGAKHSRMLNSFTFSRFAWQSSSSYSHGDESYPASKVNYLKRLLCAKSCNPDRNNTTYSKFIF